MKEARKILFILHLPPPIHGATVMGQSILSSTLISNSYKCSFISLSSSKKITESGKFYFSKIYSILSIYWKVFYALLFTNPDLCYTTINSKGSAFYKDFGIVLLLKLFRKKPVYHFHNKGVAKYQHKFMDDRLYRLTFRNSYAILLSPTLYPDMSKYLPEDRVFYCPNGIAVEQEETISRKNPCGCRILFISNMMEAKGVLDLISALEQLKIKGVAFECDFVGEWYDVTEDDFKRLIQEKGLTNRVHAHGALYGAKKNQFYNGADLFVFPSHDEAFPLVLLEAMQHKLPVISTNEGAISEIVDNEETGLLVRTNDVSDLASKIEYMISNPEKRKEYGDKAYSKFRQSYTLDIFEKNIKSILDQLISAK